MLQKKTKKPIGFGAIVQPTTKLILDRENRKKNSGSRIMYSAYHCCSDGLVVVGGFRASNGERYFKVVPLRRQFSGTNNRYISWANISIINVKAVQEVERLITKVFMNDYHLKVANDEAYKRFGKEFT